MDKFTKNDLISGDILVRGDGLVGVVVIGIDNSYKSVIWKWGRHTGCYVSNLDTDYTDDFEFTNGNKSPGDYNITKVYRPAQIQHLCASHAWYEEGFLKYDRDKIVVEMTMEEVCKALGKNVKIVKEK